MDFLGLLIVSVVSNPLEFEGIKTEVRRLARRTVNCGEFATTGKPLEFERFELRRELTAPAPQRGIAPHLVDDIQLLANEGFQLLGPIRNADSTEYSSKRPSAVYPKSILENPFLHRDRIPARRISTSHAPFER